MAPAARLRAWNASTSGSSATRARWRASISLTGARTPLGPFGASAYPAMTALWNAGGFEDQAAYEYGLALILDGIERSFRKTDGTGGVERSVQ